MVWKSQLTKNDEEIDFCCVILLIYSFNIWALIAWESWPREQIK